MTKQELIDRVATRIERDRGAPRDGAELPKKTVAFLIDTVFAELGEYFIKAKTSARKVPRFTYPGFGTFTKKERKARTGRDPRSGEAIEIPARATVGFAPGQEMREGLRRKGGRAVRRG